MNNILYTILAILSFCLLQTKSYGQQTEKTSPEVMKQKIAKSLPVSDKRAEEIQKVLAYNQKEIDMLMSKKIPMKAQVASLRKLVAERQVYIANALSTEERAKLETLVPAEIKQRKAASIQKIQAARQQPGQSSTKKTNP